MSILLYRCGTSQLESFCTILSSMKDMFVQLNFIHLSFFLQQVSLYLDYVSVMLSSAWCAKSVYIFYCVLGSADKTVKFWDLETFEMIGSGRREVGHIVSLCIRHWLE